MTRALPKTVTMPCGGVILDGDLSLPRRGRGVVLFVHGSARTRPGLRNRFVAEILQENGLGTLLFDLLTAEEEIADHVDAHLRFDIGMLADRLVTITDWVCSSLPDVAPPIGYLGASTGAAAALIAAGRRTDAVAAVVARGGRPDLAGDALNHVMAPTLLIVGGDDEVVLRLNQAALRRIVAPKRIAIVPGATHLFDEPGALSQVAQLAAAWFIQHLEQRRPAGAETGLERHER